MEKAVRYNPNEKKATMAMFLSGRADFRAQRISKTRRDIM